MNFVGLFVMLLVVGTVGSIQIRSRKEVRIAARGFQIISPFRYFDRSLEMAFSEVSDVTTLNVDAAKVEALNNIPVPKVPAAAWRWPPSWPFPADYLDPVSTKENKLNSLDSSKALKNHLSYFISDNDRVLEIGTDNPILATKTNFQSCSISEFTSSPDTFRMFDAVVITSGVESLFDPRSFFKAVWKSLKPGGTCHTSFYGLPAPSVDSAAKMWTTMNDEQKIWIAGSYFQYSVNGGWNSIEGYDILDKNTTQLVFDKSDAATSSRVYSVKAIKATTSDTFDNMLSYELLPLDNIDSDDRSFLTSRLMAMFIDTSNSDNNAAAIFPKLGSLSEIYSILLQVGDNILPKSIKAMLASLLFVSWTNSPSQIAALKRGVGVESSSDDSFWPNLNKLTAKLAPREKILLLADLVANWDRSENMLMLPESLSAVIEKLSTKLDTTDDSIIQQLGVDLIISDYLLSHKSDSLNRILRFIEDTAAVELNRLARK